MKPQTVPYHSDSTIFRFAPMFGIILLGSLWSFINIYQSSSKLPLNIFMFFTISALAVYSVIFTAWAGNSFYSVLGGIRAAAQLLAYDVVFGISLIPFLTLDSHTDIFEISETAVLNGFTLKFIILIVIIIISLLAEASRTPFDLPEAEAELVAGYHVETSGFMFALFFLGEYSSMLVMSIFCSLLLSCVLK
jgi:NADH-quinone oxidoreductase subunit H